MKVSTILLFVAVALVAIFAVASAEPSSAVAGASDSNKAVAPEAPAKKSLSSEERKARKAARKAKMTPEKRAAWKKARAARIAKRKQNKMAVTP